MLSKVVPFLTTVAAVVVGLYVAPMVLPKK
jgi:hypothetical protein